MPVSNPSVVDWARPGAIGVSASNTGKFTTVEATTALIYGDALLQRPGGSGLLLQTPPSDARLFCLSPVVFGLGTNGDAFMVQIYPNRHVNFTGSVAIGEGTPIQQVLSATAMLDFPSIAAQASADLSIVLSGATIGNSVHLGLPAAPQMGIIFQAFVSAANTVTVRATNITATSIDPASAIYRITIMRF
jgi:hypothetical protein